MYISSFEGAEICDHYVLSLSGEVIGRSEFCAGRAWYLVKSKPLCMTANNRNSESHPVYFKSKRRK
jgi:hypothetical protein